MCGLAGIAGLGGVAVPAADSLVRRMSFAVSHRGPDAEQVLVGGAVALAFRRLSLVDPVGGGQPLLSPDGQVALIANGEIYNHRELEAGLPAGTQLVTQSDCEVLVHLYQRDGVRFLDRVRGMFALIIWDRGRNRLVFARDRFGIKPLYFHHNDKRVVFASEIKALFEDPDCPRELDWPAALRDQTVTISPYCSLAAPTTWFSEVELVPAATILTIDLTDGRRSSHRFWSLPVAGETWDASAEELTGRYGELLEESVADCMMADVEIGLLLSGGVDSSTVAALAARHEPIHTFTALNASTAVNGDAESARAVARALGLPNHQVIFPPGEHPSPAQWRDLLWLLETPLCGPEQYYKFRLHQYARQLRPNLKAMLLGQASDEFNGGYFADLGGDAGWAGTEAALRQLSLRHDLLSTPELAPWWEERSLLKDTVVTELADGADPLARFLTWKYRDIQQYHLWHEDRTAAGNGIEARVPFLDHRIVELTCGVPAPLRERLFWDKRILRDAVAHLMPAAIASRPKAPFIFGVGAHHTRATFLRMLSADGGALVEQALNSPAGKDLLDADAVRGAVQTLRDNPAAWQFEQLLRVVNLGLLDALVRELPPPPAAGSRVAVSLVAHDESGDEQSGDEQRWDEQRWDDAVALALGGRAVTRECVPRRASTVMLLSDPDGGSQHYVAINAVLEFVVDAEADAAWWGVLRGMDGVRPLGELVDAAGVSLAEIADHMAQAQDAGVVCLVDPGGEHG